jgi:hypothetical protein
MKVYFSLVISIGFYSWLPDTNRNSGQSSDDNSEWMTCLSIYLPVLTWMYIYLYW